MIDLISIPRVAGLHPKYIQPATSFIDDCESGESLVLRVTQGYRTMQQQQDIYNEGRTTPGPDATPENPLGKITTWAVPGTSYHNYGLAIDIVPLNPDGSPNWNYDYHKLIPYATKYGIVCGITFPPHKTDPDHFELTFGWNWRQLMDKYTRKDFIPGTQFVNL